MKKHFLIFISLFKISFISDLEFRTNFAARIFADILWYLGQIVTFEVLFAHTPKLGEWNIEQVRFFLGVLFLSDALFMVFFHENFNNFSDKVVKGNLDFILTKPANSQFLVSLYKISTAYLGNIILSLAWLMWSFLQLPVPDWGRLALMLLIYIPAALILHYSCRIIFITTSFYFTRADSFQYIWHQLYRFCLRPDSIYPGVLRIVLIYVFPLAVVASVPASVVLGGDHGFSLVYTPITCLGFLWLSHKFWQISLKQYSSASS